MYACTDGVRAGNWKNHTFSQHRRFLSSPKPSRASFQDKNDCKDINLASLGIVGFIAHPYLHILPLKRIY